jgi:hypothetical protein
MAWSAAAAVPSMMMSQPLEFHAAAAGIPDTNQNPSRYSKLLTGLCSGPRTDRYLAPDCCPMGLPPLAETMESVGSIFSFFQFNVDPNLAKRDFLTQ